jgi:hypothetical protein
MMHRTLLAMALIASAGAVHAQTANPVDPYGRPLLGRNDWVRQPGDQPGPTAGVGAGMTTTTTTTTTGPGDMAVMPPATTAMPMQTSAPAVGEPLDPYGRPLIGRNDWVRQPGDQMGSAGVNASGAAGASTYRSSAMPMTSSAEAGASSQMGSGPHPVAFKDEFGFRYDAQGNRLDARGYVISPQTK